MNDNLLYAPLKCRIFSPVATHGLFASVHKLDEVHVRRRSVVRNICTTKNRSIAKKIKENAFIFRPEKKREKEAARVSP